MFKRIEFARTPCYGTCPVFDVEINHDGSVKWNGHMYVYRLGEEEFKISNKKIEKIEALLKEFDFRSFTYRDPDSYATDHPSCITRVEYTDGYVKEVDHYLGDFETPLIDEKHTLHHLEEFEKKLEQLLGLRKYINPTLYVYHLKVDEGEYVVSAPNEKEAFKLVGYTGNRRQGDIEKIGRDTTGEISPYIVMVKKKEE
ncbi:DUF6438 domain-containing protein [Bacillaceae bacterium S4-13-58]